MDKLKMQLADAEKDRDKGWDMWDKGCDMQRNGGDKGGAMYDKGLAMRTKGADMQRAAQARIDELTARCKEMVWAAGVWRKHQCSRKAVKDEYCKQHHPDTVKARERE